MQNQQECVPIYSGMQHNLLREYAASMLPAATPVKSDMPAPFPEQTPPGMAYIPFQQWEEPYDSDTGFPIGTIFPALDYPFRGGGSCE